MPSGHVGQAANRHAGIIAVASSRRYAALIGTPASSKPSWRAAASIVSPVAPARDHRTDGVLLIRAAKSLRMSRMSRAFHPPRLHVDVGT